MRVFINNRNLLSWPRAMSLKLSLQGHEVVWIDNASTYPPLLSWYNSDCPFQVIRLESNDGCGAPWRHMPRQDDFYAVTDPDLDISGIPDSWPEALIEGLQTHQEIKCGFSLEDRDLPGWGIADHTEETDTSFWLAPIFGKRCRYYRCGVDTTFAVYRPDINAHMVGGCRAGMPYTARHLPWYVVPEVDPDDPRPQIPIDDEIAFYLEHAEKDSSFAGYDYIQRMVADYRTR